MTLPMQRGYRFVVYHISKRGERNFHCYYQSARPIFALLATAIGIEYQVIQIAGSGKEYDVTPYMLKELAYRHSKPSHPKDYQERLL